MMLLKRALKPVYQGFNSTVRLALLKSRERSLWIATYHRVLPPDDPRSGSEEPGMVVEPETLRLHFETFRDNFQVVKLSDWIEAAQLGKPLPRSALAITFDDGWVDNYEYAFPLLQEYALPATLFLVTDMIESNERFWPNRVSDIVAQHGTDFFCSHFPLLGKAEWAAKRHMEAWQVIAALKRVTDVEIETALAEFEARHAIVPQRGNGLLNWAHVHEMQASGLMEMGSHTRRHRRLTQKLSEAILQDEIVTSKTVLEERLNRPVKLFCYPNGDHCARARELVHQHYMAGLTTSRGVNLATENTVYSRLKRFSLHQDASRTPQQLLSMLARSA